MEDRQEEVLKQYDFKVHNTYRARGAFLLDTNQGVKIYKSFEGSQCRLEFENRIKAMLIDKGYKNVDITIKNISGELITENTQGKKYTVKNWFLGEECNLRDTENVAIAADNLGRIHNLLRDNSFGEEKVYYDDNNLIETFEKHNRELKRVRGYIREKKQKNEFEIGIMNSFNEFYQQAEHATSLLRELDYMKILEETKKRGSVSHGSYTYHNIIMNKGEVATTNFEKTSVGIQIFDLYYFLRKAMEKSDWKLSCGKTIMDAYNQYIPMKESDWKLLYILTLYPDKYWKIINFYYNGKKSWISHRNMQKLNNIRGQNPQKNIFLEKFIAL